jgi:hypothetical protein
MRTIIVPLKLINLQDDGFHLLVEIVVFGQPGYAVVDTGASRSVFDKTLTEQQTPVNEIPEVVPTDEGYATTLFSTSSTGLATIPILEIGKLKIKNYAAIALDLQSVNEAYSQFGHPSISGIIGGDILMNYRAKLDYDKMVMKLYR